MTDNDSERFAKLMMMLGEAIEKFPSQERIEIYWQSLKDLSIDSIERACHIILQTKTFPVFPLIGEIREAASVKDRALLAWLQSRQAVGDYGPYRSIIFPDTIIHSVIEAMGGWEKFCDCPDDIRTWKQKEFERLYNVLQYRNNHPPKVCGIHEIGNRGIENPPNTTIDLTTENYLQLP